MHTNYQVQTFVGRSHKLLYTERKPLRNKVKLRWIIHLQFPLRIRLCISWPFSVRLK